MVHPAKKQAPSRQTKEEAMKIAKATQRPGQTKEQTRLIAQGIQNGIDLYKKQQKRKARDLDKKLKQASRNTDDSSQTDDHSQKNNAQPTAQYKQHWLPWGLLLISWGLFAMTLLRG
ncbi:hypothetical protein ACH42_05925 [Endozoicomonas sp. (ex Bugula neritina AB1)]|nr:hypothetical protein ACH42_05925 [Endozoicomonas sp. (ex Bugula neritina AB1)]